MCYDRITGTLRALLIIRSKLMSDSQLYVQDIIELHRAVHRQLRDEVASLDAEALNWTPGPETNSVGTIVTHALGAEAEMLRNILQIPTKLVSGPGVQFNASASRL